MRKLIVVLLVMVSSGVASAQYAAPPPPQPYYGPQPYYAQPQPVQVQLSVDEQWLLQRGYISPGEHIGGGVVSLFFGFGVGQAVQGRWSEKGYIFTVGEAASFGAILWGLQQVVTACDYHDPYYEDYRCNQTKENRGATLLIGGLVAMSVFRIWEVVDAFTGPSDHNRRLSALRGRLGYRDGYALRPFVAPAGDSGGIAGVSMRF